jgi:hypothetical protein
LDRDASGVHRRTASHATGAAQKGGEEIQGDPMKIVRICVNTDALPGDVNHIRVLATEEAARRWFEENDPEGIAFEYPVQE